MFNSSGVVLVLCPIFYKCLTFIVAVMALFTPLGPDGLTFMFTAESRALRSQFPGWNVTSTRILPFL